DPGSGLSVLFEVVVGSHQWEAGLVGGHAGEALSVAYRFGQVLSHHFSQERFVVERLELGGGPALEEVDHAFGLGGEMGHAGDEFVAGGGRTGEQIGNQ